jgi:hypothetical protein
MHPRAAAPAHVLLRLLLLGPCVLLLGLPALAIVSARESMCVGPAQLHERKRGSTARILLC